MTARIVVAEDDAKQAHVIKLYLEHHGHQVITVHDGQSALDACRGQQPDLLVLDVMLPRVNGIDVCRVLRVESGIPIVLLTARTTENDLLLGLDVGADDYITKPFSPRELVARVRALLRRAGDTATADRQVLSHGALEVDTGRSEVRVDGRPISLTAKEFGILEVLAKDPGRVFTRAEIVDQAFGFDHRVLDRTVDAHIMNLRRKLQAAVDHARYVQTIYGRGYRLADPC
jgi:DNA-binding response OmpR family regulator